jgi:hypothetical protein
VARGARVEVRLECVRQAQSQLAIPRECGGSRMSDALTPNCHERKRRRITIRAPSSQELGRILPFGSLEIGLEELPDVAGNTVVW